MKRRLPTTTAMATLRSPRLRRRRRRSPLCAMCRRSAATIRAPVARARSTSTATASWLSPLLLVLVGALHPDEGLQVDHVARAQVAHVAPHGSCELEQAGVSLPIRAGAIAEVEAI